VGTVDRPSHRGERDAEQEELRGLIAYCHERVDLLNSSDADFIVSMKRIVERYAVTPRQFGTLVAAAAPTLRAL
jgi:hypothetical protein